MASVAFTPFEHFIENLAAGAFDFTSDSTCTVKFALVAAANAPNLGTAEGLGDLTVVSLTNLLGSDIITGITAVQASGSMPFTMDDAELEADGGDVGPFQFVVFYDDDTTGDKLIGMLDYGSDFTIEDGATFFIKASTLGSGAFATLAIA
jgi:hypothetical protein